MNELQTKRLKESIAHWERMRDDPECEEVPCSADCPCCRQYQIISLLCGECPIFEFTGKINCRRTPYGNAAIEFVRSGKKSSKFKEAAQAEIDFLNEVLNQ